MLYLTEFSVIRVFPSFALSPTCDVVNRGFSDTGGGAIGVSSRDSICSDLFELLIFTIIPGIGSTVTSGNELNGILFTIESVGLGMGVESGLKFRVWAWSVTSRIIIVYHYSDREK